jgi:hypothetical protein
MREHRAFRRTAVRYWERRRIIYNLALVLPACLGFAFADTLNWAGDPHTIHKSYLITWFALSAVGANFCYSFAYAMEFFFGGDDPASSWLRFERNDVFIGGILFGMLLALVGGYNIAQLHWNYEIVHGG